MSLYRQNKDSDFVYRMVFQDKDGNAPVIPGKVTVVFSTEAGQGSFTAKYNPSGECSGCRKADGGLDVFLPLSRCPIGKGRLIITTTIEIPGEEFPDGVRYVRTKTTTDILLWDGATDGSFSVTGSVVL